MNIRTSKKTAKVLGKAIWLLVNTCNANRGGDEFIPNEKIMDDVGVTVEDLHNLVCLDERIGKLLQPKNRKK